jgi:predicted ATPase
MLTRLTVSGFKNLVDVDVYFGPFTCIAGANGVGKSNLFDVIQFLSFLADRPLMEAALSVRDESRRMTDVRSIFHRVGDDYDREMSLAAEMIIPPEGVDDLGQTARAAITFLRYELVLRRRDDGASGPLGSIEIKREALRHIPLGDAPAHIRFKHSARGWRASAISGRRSAPFFISTVNDGDNAFIRLHSDSGSDSGGRPLSRAASNLPRTVLSVSNAAESRTALLARKEMQAWRLLQLEPSALRQPDDFTAPVHLRMDGAHLPATLYNLARTLGAPSGQNGATTRADPAVFARVASRLSELINDIRDVRVDRDEKRELLTLEVTDRANTPHPARSLSDGTLRFLALAVLEMEPESAGVICLEEPENGIHPERIPAMLRLLQDIATDPSQPVGPENPLRQVIINTHSPVVVSNVPDDSLLVAELKEGMKNGRRFTKVAFSPLDGTWRGELAEAPPVSRGRLLSYLNPLGIRGDTEPRVGRRVTRVKDRKDLQPLLPLAELFE